MAAASGLVASHVATLYSGRVRARLGYDLGDFLPFVAAGVATNEFAQSDVAPLATGSVRRATGWTAGAGLDWKVALPVLGNTVLRAEYVYEAYPSTALGLNAGPIQSKISTQFVRVGLIARIGDRPAPDCPCRSGRGRLVRRLWRRASPASAQCRQRPWRREQPAHRFGATGPLGGMYAGRNFTFGHWVLGARRLDHADRFHRQRPLSGERPTA